MAADADTPDGELSETETSSTSESTAERGATDQPEDEDAATVAEIDSGSKNGPSPKRPNSLVRQAIMAEIAMLVALAAVAGWLGFRVYQSHVVQAERALFVQVGRQGALNLTTIDWQRADTDVQRILDSATGKFYDDLSKRQQSFVEVVRKAQSKSEGTITEAGLESESAGERRVLVAVSVKTSNLGAAEQHPRAWRMRISVQKAGNEVKVSNVEFVP